MKPTIGRTVLYNLPPRYWDHVADDDRVRPAIITRINSDVHVNLRVIHDPSDDFMVSQRDQINVDFGADTSGCWHWPLRV